MQIEPGTKSRRPVRPIPLRPEFAAADTNELSDDLMDVWKALGQRPVEGVAAKAMLTRQALETRSMLPNRSHNVLRVPAHTHALSSPAVARVNGD